MAENMLQELRKALLYELPVLLTQREKWDSLIVNRRKPYTYRVHTQLASGLRCCLHKFDPCHDHEAFAHPHPWEGAFIVLEGGYKMWVGHSQDRVTSPDSVMTLVLRKHSEYEIVNPLTWHSVIPLMTTYTVMVNGMPWTPEVAHQDVRTTKGKDLEKMPEDELRDHLRKFEGLVREWRNMEQA
jgi:hypothetical protein